MAQDKARTAAARAADGAPDSGPDDCYNRVTQTCNRKHPGQTMGDKTYRDCISAGLDWCDVNEATRLDTFPAMEAGRFVYLAAARATDGGPDSGPDDCYNRVTQTCNRKHPGQTMGDQAYRDCINSGLDWCDVYEPTRLATFPAMEAGRFLAVKG
jgi:hypothetical protein